MYRHMHRHACLTMQALFVPSQGFMNALAYGWTRGDFLSVMTTRRHNRTLSDSVATSYEGMEEEEEEETEVEDEREDWERGFHPENSLLSSFNRARDSMTGERRQRGNTALTPVSPGELLGDV